MANDVFDIKTDLSIRYFDGTSFVEIVADSAEVEIDRGIDIEKGVLSEPHIGTARVTLIKSSLADFLGTPGYKSNQQFEIRYRFAPDTNPTLYNVIFSGLIQNVSMNYLNESGVLQVEITANDAMKTGLNTFLASHSVTGTVAQRSFINCMINLRTAINAVASLPAGISLTQRGTGAAGTTQRAFTWTSVSSGEIFSKFVDAELSWFFGSKIGYGMDYMTRNDLNTLQAITYTAGSPTVSNVHYQNLVANPNFEVNTTGYSPGTSVTLTRDTSQFYMGVASMKVASTATTSTVYNFQTNTTMGASSGQKFKASLQIKNGGNSSTARVQINYINAGGFSVGLDSGPFVTTSSTDWTEIFVTSVAPATTVRAEIRVQINKTAAAVASVFVDNVKLELLSVQSTNHFCMDQITLAYDSDDFVNKVKVTDATTGTSVSATNTASVTANGEQLGLFTVDLDGAGVSTYSNWASEVATNASLKQVSGVSVPAIREDGKVSDIANWDVGSTLQVEFANDPLPTLQLVSIVSRVTHIITPEHWEVNLGLWRGV